ncbi:MAG TPA: HIT domain-containing protein [Candidatus Methylomirabilis sp.]|nr:HIT domain-containing protein [Candidatus Methylomirabilis sp.]
MIWTLWAPWRMAYIEGAQRDGCLFCEKPREGVDRKNLILSRGPLTYVVMNLFPYSNGHLMIVPYRHCSDLTQLSPEESLELMQSAQRCTQILQDAFRAEGFNIGFNLGKVAGAGIADHLHLHIVPRWMGDTNFMPVLADTKVMPEYLEVGYDKLYPLFQGQGR